MPSKNRSFAGSEVRNLMQSSTKAALSTLSPPDKQPFVSLVTVAIEPAGAPIILISDLAWHTKNLNFDSRAALLFETCDGLSDPLAGSRVSLIGAFEKTQDKTARACFLECHKDAALYADFSDFGFWRMTIEKAHAIAGFGRIETLEAHELLGVGI